MHSDSDEEYDSDDDRGDERLFKVEEHDLEQYLVKMRLDGLFTELVEELLVEAPANPVKFMVDYLFTQFPDQAHCSSYAKTFPDGTNSVGGGIPLTGIVAQSAFVTRDSSNEEDNDEEKGRTGSEDEDGDSLRQQNSSNTGEEDRVDKDSEKRSVGRKGASAPPMKQLSAEKRNVRRKAICDVRHAASISPHGGEALSEEEKSALLGYMHTNLFFQQLESYVLDHLLQVFVVAELQSGATIFEQGASGNDSDTFYFCHKGQCEHKTDSRKSMTCNAGDSLGEMALFLDVPRKSTAYVSSQSNARLFCIKREEFKRGVVQGQEHFRLATAKQLAQVPLFARTLDQIEIDKLILDVVKIETFQQGHVIVKQHTPSDKFFLVNKGSARCEQKLSPSDPNVLVTEFGPGDWFGEVALITDRPRAASVTAESDSVECLTMTRDAFVRVFGPLTDILKRDEALFRRFVSDKI